MSSGIKVDVIHGAYINWSWPKKGFGQLDFHMKDGVLHCDNECMSRESVRQILYALADHVADTAKLYHEPLSKGIIEDLPKSFFLNLFSRIHNETF